MTDRLQMNIDLAKMLKNGVIMDVTNAEQAVIAEKAGAVAVMALERVPSDIRRDGVLPVCRIPSSSKKSRLPSAFRLWPKPESDTLWKRKFWKNSELIILMNPKC